MSGLSLSIAWPALEGGHDLPWPPPFRAIRGYENAKLATLSMLEAYQESYGMKWAYMVSADLQPDKFDVEFGHVVPSLIEV